MFNESNILKNYYDKEAIVGCDIVILISEQKTESSIYCHGFYKKYRKFYLTFLLLFNEINAL